MQTGMLNLQIQYGIAFHLNESKVDQQHTWHETS